MEREHQPGGSEALRGLIDDCGYDALAWDLHGQGVDLWEWLTDLCSEAPTRHPSYLLGLLEWLPDDGAVTAVYALRRPPSGDGEVDPGRRRFFGWGADRHLLAEVYDLLAAVNTAKGKPPRYPRPKHPQEQPRTSGLAAEWSAIKGRLRRTHRPTGPDGG